MDIYMNPYNVGGRVRQHRLVVEENWERFDEKFFSISKDGRHILKNSPHK